MTTSHTTDALVELGEVAISARPCGEDGGSAGAVMFTTVAHVGGGVTALRWQHSVDAAAMAGMARYHHNNNHHHHYHPPRGLLGLMDVNDHIVVLEYGDNDQMIKSRGG